MDDVSRTNRILKLQMLVIVVFVIAAIFTQMHGRFGNSSHGIGPATNISDWPEPIQDLYRSLIDAGVDTETFSVFLLASGFEESCVCRMDVDDGGWDVIQQKLELQAIPESDVNRVRESIVSAADSSWWPTSTDNAEYFASAGRITGHEGDLYYAARDTDTGRVSIHYYFNF